MRAVSRDYDAASLMGIDLNRTIAEGGDLTEEEIEEYLKEHGEE